MRCIAECRPVLGGKVLGLAIGMTLGMISPASAKCPRGTKRFYSSQRKDGFQYELMYCCRTGRGGKRIYHGTYATESRSIPHTGVGSPGGCDQLVKESFGKYVNGKRHGKWVTREGTDSSICSGTSTKWEDYEVERYRTGRGRYPGVPKSTGRACAGAGAGWYGRKWESGVG